MTWLLRLRENVKVGAMTYMYIVDRFRDFERRNSTFNEIQWSLLFIILEFLLNYILEVTVVVNAYFVQNRHVWVYYTTITNLPTSSCSLRQQGARSSINT